MSKAQGDGYKTWTNNELNDYRRRLDAKLSEMSETTDKWYVNDGFVILARSWNVLINPNGSWKWNGWKVLGKQFQVSVFDESDVTPLEDGTYDVHGPAIAHQIFDNRDEAIKFFLSVRY